MNLQVSSGGSIVKYEILKTKRQLVTGFKIFYDAQVNPYDSEEGNGVILIDPALEMNQVIAVTSSCQISTLSTGVVFRHYPNFHRIMEAVNANYLKSIHLTTRYPTLNQSNFSSGVTYEKE